MGIAVAKPATIVLKIDPGQVDIPIEAGGVLKGTIYLDAHVEVTECSVLQLIVAGAEYTAVHHTTSSGVGKKRKVKNHLTKSTTYFWTVNVPVVNCHEKKIAKGNYAFPFECTVPSTAPSSTYRSSSNSYCKVEYTVKACLSRPDIPKGNFTDSKTFHVIAAPAPVPQAPLYMEPSCVSVNTCFFNGRGHIYAGGSSAASVLVAGESVRLNYAVQNESRAQIKSIEVALYEVYSWRACKHKALIQRALFKQTLSALPSHNETNLPDSALLATKKGYKEVNTDDDITQLRLIKSMLESGRYATDIPILPDTQTSFCGEIIQVTHRLSITVRTSMGTANPEINHPVTIVRRAGGIVKLFAIPTPPMAKERKVPGRIAPMACSTQLQDAQGVVMYAPAGWEPLLNELPEGTTQEKYEELPAYWKCVQSPVYYVPTVEYSLSRKTIDGKRGEVEDELDSDVFEPTAPFGSEMSYTAGGINPLITEVKVNIDPCTEVRQWLRGNAAHKFKSDDLQRLFSAIFGAYHQILVAEILSEHISQISCVSLAEACRGCNEFCRREVVEILVKKATIVDKENKHLVQQYLSPYQFMCVEEYFALE